ncbi:CHAT domain-containing protein [Ephemerocybe angulata]|uniref:CHAT domain-containing protein n=1 Tax=Ephemerocybe angulata TaxID=980116 RepID=A0A8H6IJ11_9AGAR|nr:CHAT domain-containing protein [Tulosesus angulatus]
MGQQSSLVTDHAPGRSQLLMTDIVFECTDRIGGAETSLNLANLCVLEAPGLGDAKNYKLVSASAGRWEVDGFIEIDHATDAVDCVLKSDAGEDVGFLHLDVKEIRSESANSENEPSREVEMCDDQIELTMRWKNADTQLESIWVDDDVAAQLNSYAVDRWVNFEKTGELSTLNDGISFVREAVDLTPQGHPSLPRGLSNLGGMLCSRFERAGELSDLADAITLQQKAVELTPQGHADLPAMLNNLGVSFTCRFERTGELSDIADAIAAQQKAVELTPQGHDDLPNYLNNLGGSFTRRFERTGKLSDIAEAIILRQKAVELTPRGHADLPGMLNNLGNSFTCRFERTGELSDIADAIAVRQKAVELTPEGHADLPGRLNNLGGSFTRRFERTGELSDIADAIAVQRKAVDLTPQGHADLPSRLTNLGASFTCRFERTGELSDIADAIAVQRKAVDLTPQGHADLPSRLTNLGGSFTRRFERTGELSDIADAIAVQQKAVDLTPQGHADLPSYLSNLGGSFTHRFVRTGELSDIANAIAVRQKAVDLTPQGHADLTTYINNLGGSFYQCYRSSGRIGDLEDAISRFKTASISSVGSLRVRVHAAQQWARRSIEYNPSAPEIIAAFDTALSLVAMVAGLERTVKARYTQLEETSGLALEAAAVACALERPDKALKWLEQGRCLVWTQLNNLRTPLDDLRIQDEALAQEIANVSAKLESAGSSRVQSHVDMSLPEKMSLEVEARAHSDLAKKWADLLRRARALPGFESFLKPSPCSAIMSHLPESGPIIVSNVDECRCDALALLAGMEEPLHIPLPNFSIDKAKKYRAIFDNQLRARKLRAREVEVAMSIDDQLSLRGLRPAPIGENGEDLSVHRALRGLWEEVSVDQTSGEALPRVWWCPTGPLSFLPLHAAGIYQGSIRKSVSDYVVSSYTPTVTALTNRVKNDHFIDSHALGLFLTSQPNVPSASPIPGTTKEVQSIFKRAEESGLRASKLEGDEMSVAACLERMQEYSSIHLACHGSQNAAEPLKSRFLFHQGDLELGTILRSNLKHADLAFLSACQTSTGQEALSDEAVHLAAGMLAAGYRRVIGTMWSIGDAPAQKVATTFYEYLFSHRDEASGSSFDGSLSAVALHDATQQLRRSLDDSEYALLTWIPFVHFGL